MNVLIGKLLLASTFLLLLSACAVVPENRFYAENFETIKSDHRELRKFVELFPKGGDLHNHFSGAVYAESYLAWAAEDDKCIHLLSKTIFFPPCALGESVVPVKSILGDKPFYSDAVDALSIRNYQQGPLSGHDQFFSTFEKFGIATYGREGDMLAEITQRAASQNILYLELMVVVGMAGVYDLAQNVEENYTIEGLRGLLNGEPLRSVRDKAIIFVNNMEKRQSELLHCNSENSAIGCGVTVRYIPSIVRTLPRKNVLVQAGLVASLVAENAKFVGINILAPEDDPIALSDYDWHMALIRDVTAQYPQGSVPVSLHAGELTPELVSAEELEDHIQTAISIAGATRIGHGVGVSYEKNYQSLLRKMAGEEILVEINLTSNDVILGVTGDQHPFQTFLDAGVPLAISTDDEGVSRIDLSTEYQRAIESYDLSYEQLKMLSRNSLEYSFLPGQSLFLNAGKNSRKPVCMNYTAECKLYLNENLKAQLQWTLERKFKDFEKIPSRS